MKPYDCFNDDEVGGESCNRRSAHKQLLVIIQGSDCAETFQGFWHAQEQYDWRHRTEILL